VSSLVGGARRLSGRGGPGIGERLDALGAAADAASGRLDEELVERARGVVRRGTGRLALAGHHTVVALAGATGSGKSSLFNALAGADLTAVGVRRPTTSDTTGVAFGGEDAAEVLDWLGVARRHQVTGRSDVDGLVLLDLPDHDSTEVAHHLEVDRLVQLVDLLVWVVDPQKYADAALHERYLRPLATHREVMVAVLNHVDEVAPDSRAALVADLRRRLAEDGLEGVPVLTTSATHGDGVPELWDLLADRVARKRAAADRLAADVGAAVRDLRARSGSADPRGLTRTDRRELLDAFADAAGVPTVVRAVERSVARRGAQHTGWPVTAWLSRLRPDPLRRLHLDLGESGAELTALGRASLPEPTRVQRARVDTAVRATADAVGAPLAPAWADAVRRASVARLEDLNDALDRAVVGTDLGASRTPLWWRATRVLQVLLAVTLLAGALWLGGLAVLGYLRLPAPDPPDSAGLPLPTLLLVVGAGGGLALSLLGRVANRLVARSRARGAGRRLRSAIAGVAEELVERPIAAELAAYDAVREALDVAAGGRAQAR
jgi:GTP-binding protein EngB required for normal cell division